MKQITSFTAFIFILVLLGACNNPKEPEEVRPNIILLIGDGMGLSQMSSALYLKKTTNFERMPVVGLSKTSSSKEKITDSAAGATALACGQKTYNGAIAVNDSGKAMPTLIELLSAQGYQTGVIATSSITHATPASFYAHVESRKMHEEIAEDLLKSQVDFFAGGGLTYFHQRSDEKSLLNTTAFVIDTNALKPIPADRGPRGYVLASDGMPTMEEGRGNFLSRATQLAFDFFDHNDAPFFLMIEGSQIDWGGHANDGDYIVQEVLDFDKTLGHVLDYAEGVGNTLVVVTADHETGGFTLAAEEEEIPFQGIQRNYDQVQYTFSTGGHSATMVPVLAYGLGAQNFAGIYENTAVFDRVMQALKAHTQE